MQWPITIQNLQLPLVVKLPLVVMFALAIAGACSGQVEIETNHWNWTPSAKYHELVVKIETEIGMGTGVLIHVYKTRPVANGYAGLCLTADRV